MSEPESDTDSGDGTTRTRQVRLLQAYTRAIQDMEDETEEEDDCAFELHEVTTPNSADTPSASATEGPPSSRRRRLLRQRTISDAMENLKMDEDMAPYKLANLLFHGSVAGTLPYFTLYSRQLGLDAAQVGMVCGIRPILVSVVAPLVGWFADKYHMRRFCAILCTSLWILFALLIAVVPPPTLANCNIALERLQELIPNEDITLDTKCKTDHDFPTVNSLSRHLFLDEVIFPNITSSNSCKNNTNTSKVEPATLISTTPNSISKTDLEERVKRATVEVYETRQVNNPEDEKELSRRQAQNGSWLFTNVSLRDAFISAFILASFAEMMQVRFF